MIGWPTGQPWNLHSTAPGGVPWQNSVSGTASPLSQPWDFANESQSAVVNPVLQSEHDASLAESQPNKPNIETRIIQRVMSPTFARLSL